MKQVTKKNQITLFCLLALSFAPASAESFLKLDEIQRSPQPQAQDLKYQELHKIDPGKKIQNLYDQIIQEPSGKIQDPITTEPADQTPISQVNQDYVKQKAVGDEVSNTVALKIRNELGENIKVRVSPAYDIAKSKIFYLRAYETLDAGEHAEGDYNIYVYDSYNRFEGFIKKSFAKSLGVNNVIVSRFSLVDNLNDFIESKQSKNSFNKLASLPRKIKIANTTSSDIHLDVVTSQQINGQNKRLNIGKGWTIPRSLYSPEYLLFQGSPISLSQDAELVLEDRNAGKPALVKDTKLVKNLKIDEEGDYILIVK